MKKLLQRVRGLLGVGVTWGTLWAGIGAGIYKGAEDAFIGLEPVKTINPNPKLAAAYQDAYKQWQAVLKKQM